MTTQTGKVPVPKLGPEERAEFAETIYREKIRPTLTEEDIGKFVIVDLNSGEYEIDAEDLAAECRLRARLPEAFGFIMRVGYSAPYFFGGYYEEPKL